MSYLEKTMENSEIYDEWFEKYPFAFESEFNLLKSLIPDFERGLEVGTGTGRFAEKLGISIGVEKRPSMAEKARKRGVRVVEGNASNLPFENGRFDLVLMTNVICFLKDLNAAFRECFRVLETGGFLILGFVDRKSPHGAEYQNNRFPGLIYMEPWFYSVREISYLLTKTGFENLDYAQTIFAPFREMDSPDRIRKGFGEGAFLAIRARKEPD
jgi:SAM-dependent methyltransferase